MSFKAYLALFLAFLVIQVRAWMPGEHQEIYSVNGKDLFNKSQTDGDSKRWLPGTPKIRGVNLGSLFVMEPWMASAEWNSMSCGAWPSEFDCVMHLGQGQANQAFQKHWNSWITQGDITQMVNYGLNTIRIPLGYWLLETIVYANSEHFPQGAFPYLERIVGWASDAGMYIILDVHGAPGAQQPQQPFTGQYAPSAGFYQGHQYDRAKEFVGWLSEVVHTRGAFRNVGMIELVNEPIQNTGATPGLLDNYYPNAYAEIRAREAKLGISSNNLLHIQAMNTLWGSGDPHSHLTSDWFMAYDDHRYTKWDSSVPVDKGAYIRDACHNNRLSNTDYQKSNWPTIVGEFSLSVPDFVQWNGDWHPDGNKAFYTQWFSAQIIAYERDTNGWIFWSWKTQLGDYRWGYQDAVAQGVIPNNPQNINWGTCNGV
ncbi:hypothetical protein HYALB_00000273 [Hymenoscyphus albidus]|uniref:glucan endo-1,6-beta-glucosidase n=1 Tax=Hymenoscyphus albidus TaxID=595503 RepID=A0A9N9Q490_9HELO|nr:hypothetical protein HYALB_00000273 [Hymenoscyphus albidus]